MAEFSTLEQGIILLIDDAEVLDVLASSERNLENSQKDLLAKIVSRLTIWREDLYKKRDLLENSEFSTNLVNEFVNKAVAASENLKTLFTERIGKNQSESGGNVLRAAIREYNTAVRRLTRFRRPPFDESKVQDLQEHEQDLQRLAIWETPDADEDVSECDSEGIEFPETPEEKQISFKDLPRGAEIILSPEDKRTVLSQSKTEATFVKQKIKECHSRIIDVMAKSQWSSNSSGPTLPPSQTEQYTNLSMNSQEFVDILQDINKIDSGTGISHVLHLAFYHLHRIDTAVTAIATQESGAGNRDSGSLFWQIFTSLLIAIRDRKHTFVLGLKLLEILLERQPKMLWYPEACGGYEKYGLTDYVLLIYQDTMKYGILSAKAIRGQGNEESWTSCLSEFCADEDVVELTRSLQTTSLRIDRAALKQRLASGADTHNARSRASIAPRTVKFEDLHGMSQEQEDYEAIESESETDDMSETSLVDEDITEEALQEILNTPNDKRNAASGVKIIQDEPWSLLDHAFCGRHTQLESLVDAVHGQNGAFTGRCVLFGPEVMGKTQIMLRFIRSLCATSRDLTVLWITATSSLAVGQSYTQILTLLYDRALKSSNPRLRMLAIKRHLERLDQKLGKSWVVVVDGLVLEAQSSLKEVLPKVSSRGRIFYTTNDGAVLKNLEAESGSPLKIISVENMIEGDAIDVLISASGLEQTKKNYEWSREVVQHLDFSPLPIKIVGGLMKRFRDLSTENVMRTCRKELEKHKTSEDHDSLDENPMVQAVFRFSINHIRRRRADVHALLRILSFFDGESIPFGDIVREDANNCEQILPASNTQKSVYERRLSTMSRFDAQDSGHGSQDDEDEDMESSNVFFSSMSFENTTSAASDYIVNELKKKLAKRDTRQELGEQLLASPLVGKRSNTARMTIRIHKVVRQVVLDDLKDEPGAFETFFSVALDLLVQALDQVEFSLRNTQTWRRAATLLPHFESLMKLHPENMQKDVSLIKSLSKLGDYLHASGQYKKAILYFSLCESELQSSEADQVSEKLARSYQKNDDFGSADKIFARLLKRVGEDGPVELNRKNFGTAEGLAANYYLRGWLCMARDLYHDILEGLTGEGVQQNGDSYLIAKVHEGLGNTYQRLGEPVKASEYYAECSAYFTTDPESRTLSQLRVRYNQARLLRDQGKLLKAQVALESIVEDYQRTVGKEHPDALLVSGRLAYTYAMRGQYELAEQLALKTLSLQTAKEDKQWVAISYTYWVLGGIYTHIEKDERKRKALAYFLLSLDGYESHLPAGHSFIMYVRRDYSHLLQIRSRLQEAVDVLEELAPEHIAGTAAAAKLARLYDWQAMAARKAGNAALEQEMHFKALKLAEETWGLQRRKLGKFHSDFNYTTWVLARIHSHSEKPGGHEKAVEHYSNALKGYERIGGSVFHSADTLKQEFDAYKAGVQQPSSPLNTMVPDGWPGSPEVPFGFLDEQGYGVESGDIFQSPVEARSSLGLYLPTEAPMFNQPLSVPVTC